MKKLLSETTLSTSILRSSGSTLLLSLVALPLFVLALKRTIVATESGKMAKKNASPRLFQRTSTMPAAWLVLPLASGVVKQVVSFPKGRLEINGDISTAFTLRPSSARILQAIG